MAGAFVASKPGSFTIYWCFLIIRAKGLGRCACVLLTTGALLVAARSPRTVLQAAGVTVVTHGWQGGTAEIDDRPDWIMALGTAVGSRANAIGRSVSIWDYQPESQEFVFVTVLGDDGVPREEGSTEPFEEMVLLFNWVQESADLGGGFAEAAGEALFVALMRGGTPPPGMERDGGITIRFVENPLHFIGHSRGTIVNSEAVERLGALGVIVDHVTTLDPHPAVLGGYQDRRAGIHVWENVVFADNYFRQDAFSEADLDFNGQSIPGSFDVELPECVLSQCDDQLDVCDCGLGGVICAGLDLCEDDPGYGFEHSDVHLWYFGTVDLSPDANNGELFVPFEWYDDPAVGPREMSGYFFSRIGGGPREQLAPAGLRGSELMPFRVDVPPQTWVVNGDFSYDKGAQLRDTAGYEHHGGSSDFSFDRQNERANLTSLNSKCRHNRIYVPRMEFAPTLNFRARPRFLSDEAELRVFGFGRTLATIRIDEDSGDSFQAYNVDLRALAGQTGLITFELEDAVFSQVEIDDVRIVGDAVQWPNVLSVELDEVSLDVDDPISGRITYSDSDSAVRLAVFLDSDHDPYNGHLGEIFATDVPASGAEPATVAFSEGSLMEVGGGEIFVYAEIDDGLQRRFTYAADSVAVSGPALRIVSLATGSEVEVQAPARELTAHRVELVAVGDVPEAVRIESLVYTAKDRAAFGKVSDATLQVIQSGESRSTGATTLIAEDGEIRFDNVGVEVDPSLGFELLLQVDVTSANASATGIPPAPMLRLRWVLSLVLFAVAAALLGGCAIVAIRRWNLRPWPVGFASSVVCAFVLVVSSCGHDEDEDDGPESTGTVLQLDLLSASDLRASGIDSGFPASIVQFPRTGIAGTRIVIREE